MAKRLQHRGGTTAQHSTFTGAVREVTVDTDKNTLVVHDGATAGGHPLATATNFTSTGIDDNATSTAITIDSSERVGLNTTTPGAKLEIDSTGSYYNTANQMQQWSYNGTPGLSLYFDAYISPYFDTDSASGWNPGATMVWKRQGSEKMRITNTGNVGIGTSNPIRDLVIKQSAGDAAFRMETASQVNDVLTLRNSNGRLDFGNLAMTISSSGNVGVNTIYPNNYSGYGNITINGSSGGIFDLSVGDTRTGSFTASSGSVSVQSRTAIPLILETNASEKIRIKSSGNVGIGTTNPIGLVNIVQASNTEALLRLRNNTADTSAADGMIFTITDSSSPVGSIEMISGGSDAKLAFRTNAAERMRIESNGNVGLGKVHSDANTVTGIKFYNNGIQYMYAPATVDIMRFYNSNTGTEVGDIVITSSSTSYNSISDYRLKENVSYDFDATTRLKQLKPARFNFIADADKTVDGFLAHEVSDIVPEAISGTKDAVQVWKEGEELPEGVSVGDNKLDENGNTIPEYQGIDQSKLVPLLVKTIQELEARITALENNQP